MQVELIAAEEKDREFFRRTHHLAYRQVIESMFGWDETKQDIAADTEFNERNPHIVKYEGMAVGSVGSQIKDDHIWFGPIYILPEFQSKGIGTFLVKQFMDKAKAQKLPLRLRTLHQNIGAKKLYEHLGFRVLSETDIHWHMEYRV